MMWFRVLISPEVVRIMGLSAAEVCGLHLSRSAWPGGLWLAEGEACGSGARLSGRRSSGLRIPDPVSWPTGAGSSGMLARHA